MIRKDRGVTSWDGGVAIYVKQNIKFEKIDFPKCGEVYFRHSCYHISFCLVLVYNPPRVANQLKSNFEQHLKAKILRKPIIMVGDFNLDWSSNSVLKESFETLMNLTQCSQLVTKYTICFENSSTIIDLLFTNIQSLLSEHHDIKTDYSVHFAIN